MQSIAIQGRHSESPAFFDVPARASASRLHWIDLLLIVVFFLGIYTNYAIPIAKTVPFPSAPAGVAGVLLLWRRRGDIPRAGLVGLLLVLAVYVASVLMAPDFNFLPRRLNGLIQLSYSLIIGYALFVTITQSTRAQMSKLLLACSLTLLVGCLLESYGGLRPLSDAVRSVLYNRGLYDADLRDLEYYGRIRPRLFASEPSSVTFCYTLVSFFWFVVSTSRWKLPGYAFLTAAGLAAMPGPTLLLMIVLLCPYALFIASRRNGQLSLARLLPLALACAIGGLLVLALAISFFPERRRDAVSGNDPSSFYRVQGPAIAGIDTILTRPVAGAGLTGETFLHDRVIDLYSRSPAWSARWPVLHPASELLVNYFWLHWVYLGLLMGVAAIAAITCWLLALGVPSPAFTWTTWAIMGQAAGAYVGPSCWAVLFLAAATAVLSQRREP